MKYKIAPLILLSFVVCGCYHDELGPERTERAEVDDTIYMPANHGSGSGFTMDGHVTFTDVDMPPKYAVVFKCKHGKFSIENEKSEQLYKSLSRGDVVVVHYQERIRVDDDSKTSKLIGLHFLSAEKVNE